MTLKRTLPLAVRLIVLTLRFKYSVKCFLVKNRRHRRNTRKRISVVLLPRMNNRNNALEVSRELHLPIRPVVAGDGVKEDGAEEAVPGGEIMPSFRREVGGEEDRHSRLPLPPRSYIVIKRVEILEKSHALSTTCLFTMEIDKELIQTWSFPIQQLPNQKQRKT
mmetsp:Transcript_27426/g.33233  ORF Transcript_27426/g.33233 Transcript_27426/m.33233 type:complete len:164 (-) Transcript_27426:330-821(-)